MTGRDLLRMVVSGVAIGFCFIVVMRQPLIDDAADQKAQALAEARMKARLFTKYPDSAIAQMAMPVVVKGAK